MLAALLLVCLGPALVPAPTGNAGAGAPVRIMPVGDSITETNTGHASWRYWLDHTLHDEGIPFDFVGSQQGVFGGPPLYSDFDPDHEAHSGWQTAEMSLAIEGLASAYTPDVALVHMGNTDINHAVPVTTALLNLQSILLNLRAARPNLKILVAQIVPIELSGQVPPTLLAFNSEIPALVAAVDRPESRVLLVDQFTGYDATTDTYDGFHPGESGEKKMAARWNERLHLVLDGCVLPKFAPGDKIKIVPVSAGDVFDATFDGVVGMKFTQHFLAVNAAGQEVHARVEVVDPDGLVVWAKDVDFGKGGAFSVTLGTTGRHRVRVSNFSHGFGPVAIATSRKLPKAARSVQKTIELPAAATGFEFKVRVLPDAHLDATIKLKKGTLLPVVSLLTPDGATLDLADYSLMKPNGELDVFGVPLFLPGDYTVAIGGLESGNSPVKVKALLDPKQPKTGHSTIVLGAM